MWSKTKKNKIKEICVNDLPVLTSQARDWFCFIFHVPAFILEQWFIIGRLLCSQLEFIASRTVLGLWLCQIRLLWCRLHLFLLREGLLLLGVTRTGYAGFFLLERRWICWRSADDVECVCELMFTHGNNNKECVKFAQGVKWWIWGKIIKINIKFMNINTTFLKRTSCIVHDGVHDTNQKRKGW